MVQTKLKILVAAKKHPTPHSQQVLKGAEGEDEVEMLYVHSDLVKRPSLACDGLLCIPEPGWVNVLNPTTGEIVRFSSGRNPVKPRTLQPNFQKRLEVFPGYWRMGFGRDKVNGIYKIVRLYFDPKHYGEILDLYIGEWRKLKNPPLYYVGETLKSVCVNGFIYWLVVEHLAHKILALDLNTEEFHDVPTPKYLFHSSGQLANIEDRLVLCTVSIGDYKWIVQIFTLNAKEETWSVTYSFDIGPRSLIQASQWCLCYTLLAVTKRGNLFLRDKWKRLLKYDTKTNKAYFISIEEVISPFVENLLTLQCPSSSKARTYLDNMPGSHISKVFRRIKVHKPNIWFTTTLVTLVMFRYYIVSSR